MGLSVDRTLRAYGFNDGHACGFYRIRQPFAALLAAGHEVEYHAGWNNFARDFDVIVGQRIGNSAALPIWRRLRAGHKLVYETDDDLWTIDPTNFSAYLAHGPVEQEANRTAIETSNLVTCTTEPLAETLRKYHDNVWVLPNCIEAGVLEIERPQRDRVTVGWAGGDSHLRDIAAVEVPLRRFLQRNPKVDFHMIGSDFRGPCRLPGRYTGWSADIHEYYRTIDFDIGIAPLAQTIFNRSKSHVKILEYSALGIPSLATDWDPYNGGIIIDGVTGYLIRNDHEWGKRLYELANDEAMRTEMGAAARRHAANFTIQEHYTLWEAAYASL